MQSKPGQSICIGKHRAIDAAATGPGNVADAYAPAHALPFATANAVLKNIAIVESPEMDIVGTNAPAGSFTATGITMNGQPVTIITTTPVT